MQQQPQKPRPPPPPPDRSRQTLRTTRPVVQQQRHQQPVFYSSQAAATTTKPQATAQARGSYYGAPGNNASIGNNNNNSWDMSSNTAAVTNDQGGDDDWFSPDTTTTTATTISSTNPAAGGYTSNFGSSNAAAPYSSTTGFSNNSNSNNSLQGNMNTAALSTPQPSYFTPQPITNNNYAASGTPSKANYDDFDDLPLLEELGINIEHIYLKTKAVVLPFKRFHQTDSALHDPQLIIQDADLAGPLALALLLGAELLLTGKLQFGYIYGFGMFGCLCMTLVINLLSPTQAVSVWTVTSILGYALLPVNLLAAVRIILPSSLGRFVGFLTILWSTTASTRLLEVGCGMRDQRYLLAYPIALLYSAFVLITIF